MSPQEPGYVLKRAIVVSVFLLALFLHESDARAQTPNTALAAPVAVSGVARDGDIISYDATSNQYISTQHTADSNIFGVIVDDPVMYLAASTTQAGVRPVVTVGEVMVNVSTLGGEIRAGDLITSSNVVGVGRRVDRDKATFVLGFALSSMEELPGNNTVAVDGKQVRLGRVPVALRIGYYTQGVDAYGTSTIPTATSAVVAAQDSGQEGFDTFKLIRYILGALVALSAVVLALRRFGDLFAQSIVSVGRNPLARSQIRSILVWNAVLIVIVSSVGLGIGVAIIMMP
jgi:hypothetical protein